jgi:hypothetical protein
MRLLTFILILLSIFTLPFWVSLILSIFAIIYFDSFLEIIFFGFLYDLTYTEGGFIFLILSFIIYIIVLFIKDRTRIV